MLETDVEEELHEKLIDFANSEPKIKAIFKGTSPEYPHEGNEVTYWFLIGRENIRYDDKFEDRITDLDLEIHNNILSGKNGVGIMTWPIDLEQADNYGFIGELIYKK